MSTTPVKLPLSATVVWVTRAKDEGLYCSGPNPLAKDNIYTSKPGAGVEPAGRPESDGRKDGWMDGVDSEMRPSGMRTNLLVQG